MPSHPTVESNELVTASITMKRVYRPGLLQRSLYAAPGLLLLAMGLRAAEYAVMEALAEEWVSTFALGVALIAAGIFVISYFFGTSIVVDDEDVSKRYLFGLIRGDDRADLESQLQSRNREFGHIGAPPVPDTEVLQYYFDGPPHGGWVVVEVGVDDEHRPTGIPFWNRATGPRRGEFNRLCPRGIGELGGRAP